MDEGEAAVDIAYELDGQGPWSAQGLDLGEIWVTHEDGSKYILSVTKVEKLPLED